MNIRQMQIFRALCEELNFTKTAARLNMTQPAVSHVVAELERETGTPLFDRIGRRIYLTAAGKLLLEKITRLLELYDDISAGFAGETGLQPLKVGSCLTIANFWLPEIAGKFARACPDTPLEITVDIVSRVAAMLAANKIDIALYEGAVPANFLHTGSAGWPRRTIRWQNKNKSRFPRHCVTRCCYEKKAVPSAARSTAPCCCTVLKPRQDGPASTHRRSSAARSAAPAFASFPKSSPQTNWPPDGWCGWTLPPNRWSTKISLFIILTNTCRRRPQN